MVKRYTSLMSYLKEEDEIVWKVNASADDIEFFQKELEEAPEENKPMLIQAIEREKQKYGERVALLECCRGEIAELLNNLT